MFSSNHYLILFMLELLKMIWSKSNVKNWARLDYNCLSYKSYSLYINIYLHFIPQENNQFFALQLTASAHRTPIPFSSILNNRPHPRLDIFNLKRNRFPFNPRFCGNIDWRTDHTFVEQSIPKHLFLMFDLHIIERLFGLRQRSIRIAI